MQLDTTTGLADIIVKEGKFTTLGYSNDENSNIYNIQNFNTIADDITDVISLFRNNIVLTDQYLNGTHQILLIWKICLTVLI